MEMEPQAKKVKHGMDDVLLEFRKDKETLKRLYEAALFIDHGYSELTASFQEIELANATKSRDFSSAAVHTKEYEDSPLAIGALFRSGMEVLLRYTTKSDEDCLPDDTSSLAALKNLVYFLLEGRIDEFFHPESYTECQWAVILAQHMLSKLSLDRGYVMDNHHNGKISILRGVNDYICACQKRDTMEGYFGDTSFGCREVWHGSADIIVGNQLAVRVTNDAEDTSDIEADMDQSSLTSSDSESSIEATKPSHHFLAREKMQMISQCIIFSFLKKKEHTSLSLIPFLGLKRNQIKVFFYDCDKDILLSTPDLPFTETLDTLDYGAVVLMWLTLNYKLFCTGVPEDINVCKAKFHDCVGDKLRCYKEDVKAELNWRRTEARNPKRAVGRGRNPAPVFPLPIYTPGNEV